MPIEQKNEGCYEPTQKWPGLASFSEWTPGARRPGTC